MSLVLFELKEDHIKILRNREWSLQYGELILKMEKDLDVPLETIQEIYEELDLILNGKTRDFDLSSDEIVEYTPEQKNEWDKLLKELPTALDIILYTGKFETGNYVKSYNLRNWARK